MHRKTIQRWFGKNIDHDSDAARELQTHLDLEIEDLREASGLDPQQAQHAGRRTLCNKCSHSSSSEKSRPLEGTFTILEAMTIAQATPLTTQGSDGVAEQVPGLWVSPDFFRVLANLPEPVRREIGLSAGERCHPANFGDRNGMTHQGGIPLCGRPFPQDPKSTSLVATVIRARRAANIDPIVALRQE